MNIHYINDIAAMKLSKTTFRHKMNLIKTAKR